MIDRRRMVLVRLLVIASLLGFAGACCSAAAQTKIQTSNPDDQQTPAAQGLFPRQPSAVRAPMACPRPEPSSAIPEPVDLRSENGVLAVDLAFRNDVDV